MFSGMYKVTGGDVSVMVIGNLGRHELMHLPFLTILTVNNGQACVGARITLLGELDKHIVLGNIQKFD